MKVFIAQEILNEANPLDCRGETVCFDSQEKPDKYLEDCEDDEYSFYVQMEREIQ